MGTAGIVNFINAVKGHLTLPPNRAGQLLVTTAGKFDSRPLVKSVGLAESQAEVDEQKGALEDFETVFNTWTRISRRGEEGWTDEAIPSELDEWTFSAVDNTITCTINSASLVGFISPLAYDQFVLEAQLTSGDVDDDFIGFCIAFAEGDDGRTHTLTVTRQLNTIAPMLIQKDRLMDESYTVAAVMNGLTWQDGTVATGPIPGTSDQGWDLIPTGIRLRVTREDDIITVETSQVNDTVIYGPATVVIDLSADPELDVFRGPQRWGYVCQSQVGATWEVIQRPGLGIPVVDLRDNTLWEYVDGSWTATSSDIADLIARGILAEEWLHVNPKYDRFYYLDNQQTLTRV